MKEAEAAEELIFLERAQAICYDLFPIVACKGTEESSRSRVWENAVELWVY